MSRRGTRKVRKGSSLLGSLRRRLGKSSKKNTRAGKLSNMRKNVQKGVNSKRNEKMAEVLRSNAKVSDVLFIVYGANWRELAKDELDFSPEYGKFFKKQSTPKRGFFSRRLNTSALNNIIKKGKSQMKNRVNTGKALRNALNVRQNKIQKSRLAGQNLQNVAQRTLMGKIVNNRRRNEIARNPQYNKNRVVPSNQYQPNTLPGYVTSNNAPVEIRQAGPLPGSFANSVPNNLFANNNSNEWIRNTPVSNSRRQVKPSSLSNRLKKN